MSFNFAPEIAPRTDRVSNDDAMSRYRTAIETWKQDMEQYDRAQRSGGPAIQGFPTKPELEWCFDPSFDPRTLSWQLGSRS